MWKYTGIVAIAGVVAWCLATYSGWLPPTFVPSPTALAKAFGTAIADRRFWEDMLASNARVWASVIISVLLAIPVASSIAADKRIEAAFAPLIDFVRYLPVPALIPLTIVLVGVDELAKITVLVVGTVFQLVVLLIDDLHAVPIEYRELLTSLGIRRQRRQYWMFRQVAPQFFDNCRVSVGWCWTYVIIAELVAADRGLGHFIKEAQRFNDVGAMYVGILAMGIIGLVTDAAFKRSFPAAFPYAEPRHRRA